MPTARTALADAERRLEERQSEAKRLTLTAPADGVIMPAPRVPDAGRKNGQLAEWSGSLLDPITRGAHIKSGTLTCLVGDPQKVDAVLMVDDADVKFLEPGQHVRLRIEQLPGTIVEGEVVEVARRETNGNEHATIARADLSPLFAGLIAPGHEGSHYEARVKFESADAPSLIIGGRGDSKVSTERITVARWLWRALARTFRLPV